ncbi:SusC/RagA family TonB-linked outer membrane protein [Faecalibacter macacae]|uniref:SusC/RagA family TonB-linked outer membrane protein n=1 Tax=Faecalibacter macacae TaxID=1859289 RepID=A0A3L9M8N5_9FLAO|nr:SusC/RagA family TonB-linked outer membrane protein [Faecalibacter macacae]RLZ08306.1 SusC/RagA family TonB-linked outer membrane protein [Faecalibacter macacae]
MRRTLTSLSFVAFLGLGGLAMAQVTGVVNDANNLPEMDAEVIVKGTDKVVYTDENGKFDIDAKVGDVLIVNGKEFTVTSNNLGVLKSASENVDLDEVVITSIFDSPSKSGQTIVSGESLENFNPTLSVDQMLGGKVSGLTSQAQNGAPGATSNVTIRGAMGLGGGNKSPLFVVDGTYMSVTDMNTINPQDIQDVTVLKDASQLAIYGARGANGVVIIKTKTAKRNSKSFSYSSRIGFTEMMKQNDMDVMDSRQLLNYQNGLSSIPGVAGGVSRTPEQIENLAKTNTDWNDAFFKNGLTMSHYFNMASNIDGDSQSFSLGYDKNSGAVNYYNGLDRITATLNISSKLSDRAKYGINVNGSYQSLDEPRDINNGQNAFYSALQNRPYASVYKLDSNGEIIYKPNGDPTFNQSVNAMGYNALDEMYYSDTETRTFRLYGSAFFEYELAKNLFARTTFGATYRRLQSESFTAPSSNLMTILGSGGSKNDQSLDRFDYNWRNELSYIKSFNSHNFRATIASEYINESSYSISLSSQGYPNDHQNVQSLATTKLQTSNTARWAVTRFGYLGSLNYDYAKKYFVDGYIRRDGTSLAGLDSKYGTFWGASVAWDIAKEDFLKTSKFFNSLMLKASYGEVGDDSGLARYSNLTLMGLSGTYNNQGIASPSLNLANPNTTWEINKKLNVGLDFALLNRTLTGNVSYFKDTRTDFLFTKELPRETGSFTTTINAGELVSSGVEVELNYDIINKKDFGLGVYGTLTKMKYKINDLNGLDELIVSGAVEDMKHINGGSPYQFFMVRFAGINRENGNAQYYDKEGNITEVYNADDAVALGKSPMPTLTGGFGLNARFYGFDLNADFVFSAGGYTYNNTYQILTSPTTTNNKATQADDYWRNPGDLSEFQRPTSAGFRYSTQFLEKSDYLNFRSLSLGYSFDDLLKGTGIKGVRVFAQIQNLALWTKFHGNPIVGTAGSGYVVPGNAGFIANSYSLFSYPNTQTYSLGLNVNF